MRLAIKQAQSARATDDSTNDWLVDDCFAQHADVVHPTPPLDEDISSVINECSDQLDGDVLEEGDLDEPQ